MTILFEDRERAAEYGFAHAEELQFLAARRGVEALGFWAAEKMGLDAPGYAASLAAAIIQGDDEERILNRVGSDLARAGVTDGSSQASAVLSRATADATAQLHGAPPRQLAAPAAPAAEHHRHGFWGWDV